MMKILIRPLAAAALLGALALPASAAENYIFDGAGILSSATISSLNAKIDALHAETGKEVVVDTVSSTNGDTAQAVAERDFASHEVNGVMIFISKQPKSIGVIPDRAAREIFPSDMTSSIRSAIRSGFRSGDYDGGVTDGVNLVVETYRSHAGALRREPVRRNYVPATRQAFVENRGGGGVNWFWIIVIGVAAFILIRAIMRAVSGPRYYPPAGYGPGGPGPSGFGGGPGYGAGPGYGPGYGGGGGGFGGGGGGGFFSSLLGGLGGAFLGNELFNSFNRPQANEPVQTYDANTAGFDDGGASRPEAYDSGAFQNDAGQADVGNASFGDWGGDGGSGGDSGGGGDNSGGGW